MSTEEEFAGEDQIDATYIVTSPPRITPQQRALAKAAYYAEYAVLTKKDLPPDDLGLSMNEFRDLVSQHLAGYAAQLQALNLETLHMEVYKAWKRHEWAVAKQMNAIETLLNTPGGYKMSVDFFRCLREETRMGIDIIKTLRLFETPKQTDAPNEEIEALKKQTALFTQWNEDRAQMVELSVDAEVLDSLKRMETGDLDDVKDEEDV